MILFLLFLPTGNRFTFDYKTSSTEMLLEYERLKAASDNEMTKYKLDQEMVKSELSDKENQTLLVQLSLAEAKCKHLQYILRKNNEKVRLDVVHIRLCNVLCAM